VHNGAKDGTGRPPGTGQAPAIDHLRLILVGLLLVAVIAGVRAAPGLTWDSSWRGPWHDRQHGIALVVVLELIFACLLIALRILRRLSPSPGSPARKLRPALQRIIVLAMIAGAVPLVTLIRLPKLKPRPPTARPSSGLPKPPRHRLLPIRPSSVIDTELIKYLLLAVVLLALAAAFLILLRRRRTGETGLELDPMDDDDDGTMLRDAVEAGRTALGELSEPRMAIINCYLAMERSLAQAGAARIAAETPDELLTRSISAGLLHGSAPGELTALFYEARFSTHAVPQSARDRALHALDVISADLRGAQARRAEATAGSGAAP
jgi:hypothetical protein